MIGPSLAIQIHNLDACLRWPMPGAVSRTKRAHREYSNFPRPFRKSLEAFQQLEPGHKERRNTTIWLRLLRLHAALSEAGRKVVALNGNVPHVNRTEALIRDPQTPRAP